MPEFRNRIDMYRWQTPAYSELFSLDNLYASENPNLDAMERSLQQQFTNASHSVSLEIDRQMPSYVCFLATFEDAIDLERVQNVIYEIEGNEGWVIGFTLESSKMLRLFIRTNEHIPLNWKHVVSRITFRKADTRSSFVVGVNLDQEPQLIDWVENNNFLIMGSGGSKSSMIRNIIITAMMLNTPSEFRFALIGHASDTYRVLRDAPHALGHSAKTQAATGSRLLLGMKREIKRRNTILKRHDAPDLETCNILLEDDGEAPLPRIMLVLDTLNHVDWIKHHDDWFDNLKHIIEHGPHVGIHTIVTTAGIHLPYPFDELGELLPNRLITRTAAVDTTFMDSVTGLPSSVIRFVDSFIIINKKIIPIELPAVTATDIRTIVSYWQTNKTDRFDGMNILNISSDGEDTVRQLVRELMEEQTNTSPPIPHKPSAEALARAAEILKENEHRSQTLNIDGSMPMSANGHQALSNNSNMNITIDTVHRAQALATYLGWLGKGPLVDVLGLTVNEAKAVIAILQARQILERGDKPTLHLHVNRRRDK